MSSTEMQTAIVILIVVAVLAIAAAIWMYARKRKTEHLRARFGPEYDRAVVTHPNRASAESDLQDRAKRVAHYSIHPLDPEERSRYAAAWTDAQSLFVDDPRAAVKRADILVQDVMKHRGYPLSDFEQNAADLSVDHPGVVQNYRIAHEIAVRDAAGRGTTEDLRKAMVSYRALFENLLEQPIERREEVRR